MFKPRAEYGAGSRILWFVLLLKEGRRGGRGDTGTFTNLLIRAGTRGGSFGDFRLNMQKSERGTHGLIKGCFNDPTMFFSLEPNKY